MQRNVWNKDFGFEMKLSTNITEIQFENISVNLQAFDKFDNCQESLKTKFLITGNYFQQIWRKRNLKIFFRTCQLMIILISVKNLLERKLGLWGMTCKKIAYPLNEQVENPMITACNKTKTQHNPALNSDAKGFRSLSLPPPFCGG